MLINKRYIEILNTCRCNYLKLLNSMSYPQNVGWKGIEIKLNTLRYVLHCVQLTAYSIDIVLTLIWRSRTTLHVFNLSRSKYNNHYNIYIIYFLNSSAVHKVVECQAVCGVSQAVQSNPSITIATAFSCNAYNCTYGMESDLFIRKFRPFYNKNDNKATQKHDNRNKFLDNLRQCILCKKRHFACINVNKTL